MNLPSIKVTSADVKSAELSAIITVGPETAAKLSKKMGREVKVGEQFDLGTIAYYNQSPWKRFWGNVRIAIAQKNNPFAKPLE